MKPVVLLANEILLRAEDNSYIDEWNRLTDQHEQLRTRKEELMAEDDNLENSSKALKGKFDANKEKRVELSAKSRELEKMAASIR